MKSRSNTSWQPVHTWYNKLVGEKGQYYHQHVVIPGVIRLLAFDKNSRLLDVACGQGVLARFLPKDIPYTGIDIAPALISEAVRLDHNPGHVFKTGDVTGNLPVGDSVFTHAAIILALQNIENAEAVIVNMQKHLAPGGSLVIVLNHPAFRIPRQTSWGIDEGNKLQYRRVNMYMSPLKIPITSHPGQSQSPVTWSFHRPLSNYVRLLTDHGFLIDALEEWTSDKESEGKAKRMENRSRNEFPLFLAIRAKKDSTV